MHHWTADFLASPKTFFKVIANTDHVQVAAMNLKQGQTSGEYGTDHPHADQILLVLAGQGWAKVEGKTCELHPGDVLLICAGEKHQIRGESVGLFETINFYSPIAYPEEMDVE